MRLVLLVWLLVVGGLTPAAAARVLVLADAPDALALGDALEVALAARRVDVATQGAPQGPLRLDRAAAAQRAAVDGQADAAVWIDAESGEVEVCAVSADGRAFRHAPLTEGPAPRVFAAIAASLLDELLVEDAVTVNVDVHVDVAPVEPARAPVSGAVEGILVEAGLMASNFSVGFEGSVLFPIARRWRLGATLAFGQSFLSRSNFTPEDYERADEPMFSATAEARYSTPGPAHWELGFQGGAMSAIGEGVGIIGIRFGRAWERRFRSSLAITPVLVIVDHADRVAPALWATFRVGLTL